jgi:phosphoenolpyruvate synthase/pyruvate phosphate dikinase
MLHDIADLKEWEENRIRKTFGGKAFGLYQATKLDLPIPKTWLLEEKFYEDFVSEIGPTPKPEFAKEASKFLKKLLTKEIKNLGEGPFAVRSSSQFEDSAEHSFAGIFESKLEVPSEDLFEAIAEVWLSCHNQRAQKYLYEARSPIRMAVLIQPMIKAKYAGVAFSRHPSPASLYENHHLIIEFAPTIGENVVQGKVTPMRLSGSFGDLALQTGIPWLKDLLKTLLKLKQFLRHEVDIEFVVDPFDNFWLVQQRPVSRLHSSKILDLTGYSCKYRRTLSTLDVETLVDGCGRFLASYLEAPLSLDPWMVMTTNETGQQELWTNDLLDSAILSHLTDTIQNDETFLERIRQRYRSHFLNIVEHHYARYNDPKKSLYERFCNWHEFFSPLTAHYYAPMFLIEALHALLKDEMIVIDSENADRDLFTLGTFGTRSLIDLLFDELRKNPSKEKLEELSSRYGFLKCRVPYEKGYSADDLHEMINGLPPKEVRDEKGTKALEEKYILSKKSSFYLEHFREWMRIRNQEMEYLMFAMQKSQHLFEEIARTLNSTPEELWHSSSEIIANSLKKGKLLNKLDLSHLVIARYAGRTHVLEHIDVKSPKPPSHGVLKGQTVFGKGELDAKVIVAFSTDQIERAPKLPRPLVLVTGMTTPDFLPLLKGNFDALITDEGGILCHAAIVAREMSLPCIVGTRAATSQLKTGAAVKLDFIRGEIIPK